MKPRLGGLLALALTLLAAPAAGQDGLPLEPARTLDFTVSSGTFTSLAVSPDGRTILFDMLGEIYAVPATGGRAVPIATGIAFEVQPVFRSEEHTSELQSLMRTSYAVFCLKKQKIYKTKRHQATYN